ncbi:hypothetical protein CAPTEDRAFT_37001, partial [Capitella teleta]
PLHVAVMSCQLECVQKLLRAGADVNIRSRGDLLTPLMKAAELCQHDIVEALLAAGADATQTDAQGFSPLRYAIESHGGVSMAKTLVAHGANVNAASTDVHETPLMVALGIGDQGVTDFLLEKNADIEACTHLKESTLVRAVAAENVEIVRLILQRHSKLEALAATDCALVEACQVGSLEIARLLVDHGWNLRTTDWHSKKSCLVVAAQLPESARFIQSTSNQPRSLTSMCRIVIRKSLQPSLEEHIQELPLPEHLKQFI